MTTAVRLLRCYGDSLALPRAAEALPVEAVFALQTAARGGLLPWVRSQPNGTMVDAVRQFEVDGSYLGSRPGDVVVIQAGIVDCAPRPVPPRLRRQIARLPTSMRAVVIAFLHRHRRLLLGLGPTFRNADPAAFSDAVRAVVQAARDQKVRLLLLNIAPPNDYFVGRSPGIREDIEVFNSLMAHALAAEGAAESLVDVHAALAGDVPGLINADGHHLTAQGHDVVAKLILKRLEAA